MMKSILESLCDAPIGRNARPHEPDSPVMKTLKTQIEVMQQLRAQLTPEQAALLDAYDSLQDASGDDLPYQKFVYGFHLGAALTLEILQGQESLLND